MSKLSYNDIIELIGDNGYTVDDLPINTVDDDDNEVTISSFVTTDGHIGLDVTTTTQSEQRHQLFYQNRRRTVVKITKLDQLEL